MGSSLASLYHLFPATIHPMVVHFTIAIVYLAGFAGLIGVVWRGRDGFFPKLYLLMLFLAILATIAAGAAGVISESYLKSIPHGVASTLETHKSYGELTGVSVVIAFVLQSWRWWRKKPLWSVSLVSLLFAIVAVVFVSMAGHLGGMMVYHHGLGVS
ncbi:DUF2231 domain-containing protein [Alicyclobacillus ferrooxydans]|uniref:DUF2231 domain-containing protein n=1 Tax=Alicyclobacillus ferrooxydans TaxID=471514 RepID=UPI001FDEB3A0|nr:DUF2231 domain-containing protein [Alicyclobacillus ferrooxydans]